MNIEQRVMVNSALARYGAELTSDDRIAKGGKVTGVRVEIAKGRLRMVGGGDRDILLATYPASRIDAGVAKFAESFWYWKPTRPSA
jgi:hypothetical protein